MLLHNAHASDNPPNPTLTTHANPTTDYAKLQAATVHNCFCSCYRRCDMPGRFDPVVDT